MTHPTHARVATILTLILGSAAVTAAEQQTEAQRLCALVGETGSASAGGRNAESGRLKDAVTDQVKNLVWSAIAKGGGRWETIGETADKADDALFDPLIAAATSEDRIDSGIRQFLEGAAKIAYPAVDLTVTGGRVIVGGIAYAVEELYSMTNPGYDLRLANQIDFFEMDVVYRQGIKPDNLGRMVATEAELRRLWFDVYGWRLKDFMSQDEIKTLLADRWPSLLGSWRRGRGAMLVQDLRMELAARLRELNRKNASRGTGSPSGPSGGTGGGPLLGLWRGEDRSVIAVTSTAGGIEAEFCVVSKTSVEMGYKKGDKMYWGGKVNQLSAGEGRTVVHAHNWSNFTGGDCPGKARHDMGPMGVKLTYDPEGDKMISREQTQMYRPKSCTWADVKGEDVVTTWERYRP